MGELMFGAIRKGRWELSANLTLVTGNERHFSRVPGLAIENWLV